MALLQRMSHTGAAAATSLTGSLSPTATSFTVGSVAGWPTGAGGRPFVAVVDPGGPSEEKILCASTTGTTINVASSGRGFDNTVATSHANGAAVEHVLAAIEVDDDNRHIYATTDDDHPQYFLVNGSRPATGPATFAGITDVGVLDQTGITHLRGNTDVTGNFTASGPSSFGAGLGVTGNENITGGLTVGADLSVSGNTTVSLALTAQVVAATGITGSTTATRYVGGTTSGAPTTGTHNTGDWTVAQNGVIWVCTAAGTPGTWTPVGPTGIACAKAIASAQTTLNADNSWFPIALTSSFTRGGITFASNAFTVPATGIYRVTGQTFYQQAGNPVPPGRYIVAVYQNGIAVAQGEDWNGGTAGTPSANYVWTLPNPKVTTLVSANTGDTFDLRGNKINSGSNVATSATFATDLTIELVSR